MYDIIIVGAGPAGLTSALYALRANKKVLVLEANSYGGQILNANKVDNYPGLPDVSGFEFATNLYNQVNKYGLEIKYETVLKIDENKTVFTTNNSYRARAIIIATGAKNRKLNVKDEDIYLGKGVSYCATCDGNFFKNKIVAVVGGGNAALEDALYLSDLASKVYLIHRRDTFRGEDKYLELLESKENVEFILNSNVIKLNGNDVLESIDVKGIDDSVKQIDVSGLFIAVGQEPTNQIFSSLIKLDKSGYIESDDGVHTNVSGIYVAGDARVKKLRQLTTAVGDGSVAAVTAISEMK